MENAQYHIRWSALVLTEIKIPYLSQEYWSVIHRPILGDYRGSGICPESDSVKDKNWICFGTQREECMAATLLGPLETDSHSHWSSVNSF